MRWPHMINEYAHNQLLNVTQYRVIPGRDAVMPTIIEELQYEICPASK